MFLHIFSVPPPILPVTSLRPPWEARLPAPLAAAVINNLPIGFPTAPPGLGTDALPVRPHNLLSMPPPLTMPPTDLLKSVDLAGMGPRPSIRDPRIGLGIDTSDNPLISVKQPEVIIEIDASFAKNGGLFYILKPLTFELKKHLPASISPDDPKFKDDPRVKVLRSTLTKPPSETERQKDPRMQRIQKAVPDEQNKAAKLLTAVKTDPRKVVKTENQTNKDIASQNQLVGGKSITDTLAVKTDSMPMLETSRLSLTLPDIDFPINEDLPRKSGVDLMYSNLMGGSDFYSPSLSVEKKTAANILGIYGSVSKPELPVELHNFKPPMPTDSELDVSIPPPTDPKLSRQSSSAKDSSAALLSSPSDRPLLAHRSDPRFRKKPRSDCNSTDNIETEMRPSLPKDLFTSMDPLLSPTETSSLKDVFKTIDPTASPFC